MRDVLRAIFKKSVSWQGAMRVIVASAIVAAGWNWYHTPYRPHSRFAIYTVVTWLVVWVGYYVAKRAYCALVKKFNRHLFWQKDFVIFFDRLFLYLSLFFLVFFSRNQIASLIIFAACAGLLLRQTHIFLSNHSGMRQWQVVNGRIFALVFFLFSFFATVQYLAFRMANFDGFIKFHNIVLFRAWAMTMFLMCGFAIAVIIFARSSKVWRHLVLAMWVGIYILIVLLWGINIVVMYFSGLYFNPLMIEVAHGSSRVSLNWLTGVIFAAAIIVIGLFFWLFRFVTKTMRSDHMRPWVYYSILLLPISIGSLLGLSSFQNTPEYTIVRNFYNYATHQHQDVVLNEVVQKKLEKFGLFYKPEDFYVAHRDHVFTEPTHILNGRPNIIIIFFESFSSRLTSVYNKNVPQLTPGLEQMAAQSSTIVFRNFYNASTPTINGIIAQLCSFLPPTGYTEIENDKKLQRLRLLCLPEALKNNGYASATYITAVKKEFENKDAIFSSMSTDEIYGQDELQNIIAGEPLSWGYSDHQLFPAMWQLARQQKTQPFLMMLSTVDTHPPFDLAKDMVAYGDGTNNVLNSYHTADDAFGLWWNDFIDSPYYNNTVVVAVADHAAFPGADIKKVLAEKNNLSFYDENMLMMYIPQQFLATSTSKTISTYASSIDIAPTILHMLNIDTENNFEGRSIFGDRAQYPSVLGMHEYGLYINQLASGVRDVQYDIPSELKCNSGDDILSTSTPLTLCEYLDFYAWKRRVFEEGRFWKK